MMFFFVTFFHMLVDSHMSCMFLSIHQSPHYKPHLQHTHAHADLYLFSKYLFSQHGEALLRRRTDDTDISKLLMYNMKEGRKLLTFNFLIEFSLFLYFSLLSFFFSCFFKSFLTSPHIMCTLNNLQKKIMHLFHKLKKK